MSTPTSTAPHHPSAPGADSDFLTKPDLRWFAYGLLAAGTLGSGLIAWAAVQILKLAVAA